MSTKISIHTEASQIVSFIILKVKSKANSIVLGSVAAVTCPKLLRTNVFENGESDNGLEH